MIDPQLQDKTVLITGANNPHGIGASAARAFARQGAKVFITYLRTAPEPYGISMEEALAAKEPSMALYHGLRTLTAEQVVQEILAEGGRAAALEADLTDATQIVALFDQVEQTFGPVDVLVNNAAHYEDPDTIFTISAQALQHTFAVNAQGTILMIAEFVRRYQQRGGRDGRIINLSTDSSQCFPGQISYGASKAAIEAFTRSIAYEIGPLGITINTVAPGPTQTGYIPADVEEWLVNEIAMRRLGQPDEIADAIVFLASHQARWLTGNVVKVSGGHAL